MKRFVGIILFVVSILLFFGITFILCVYNLLNYAIITCSIGLILVICLFMFLSKTRSEESLYNAHLKDILKTFDAVLINSFEIPSLEGRNVVKVASFEDLMDAQIEIRKPIYYKKDLHCCDFVLLDDKEACTYILKENNDIVSPLEMAILELENKKNKSDYKILDDIEKTTIIKLDNNKTYKVSPINSKEKTMVKNFEEWKDEFLPKLKEK